MERLQRWRAHGGWQEVWRHDSAQTGTPMEFSVFLPEAAGNGPRPVVWYLSGLTCSWANVTEKGEFRAACARLGLVFVAPDTSPRGSDVPDDPEGAYDFGLGAGFYVDATQAPWSRQAWASASPISSPNIWLISGAVVKSPAAPKGSRVA